MRPFSGVRNPGVDTGTLNGKVMCGYQGWFAAVGDGSGCGWLHYGQGVEFDARKCKIELWPDMEEMDADEKYATSFKHRDGRPAFVFSSHNRKTVLRHFQWMREHGIDGVFLQRFGVSLKDPADYRFRNAVTANVQAGANLHGRTWAMMYDLTSLDAGEVESVVIEDWKRLVDRMKITGDPSYLHHEGKPVVAVWGVGFGDDRRYSLEECEALVRFLKTDPMYGGNTVMLGVPTYWRTLDRDSVADERLHSIMALADIISPWTVGRYTSPHGAREHAAEVVRPDIEWARSRNLDYLPVVFPGFTWRNLHELSGRRAVFNQVPRLGGEFMWSQAAAFKEAGAGMFYVAMFDEMNEGTSIFKCTNDPPGDDGKFLTLEGLPSDHYLWLAGKMGGLLRSKGPVDGRMPTRNRPEAGSERQMPEASDPR